LLKNILSIGFEFETNFTTSPYIYDPTIKMYRKFYSKDNILTFPCKVIPPEAAVPITPAGIIQQMSPSTITADKKRKLPSHIASMTELQFTSVAKKPKSPSTADDGSANNFELQFTQDIPEIQIDFEPENITIKKPFKQPVSLINTDTFTITKHCVSSLEFIVTFPVIDSSYNIIEDKFKLACQTIYNFMENMMVYQVDNEHYLFSKKYVPDGNGNVTPQYMIISSSQKNNIMFFSQCTIKINYDNIIGIFVYLLLNNSEFFESLITIIKNTNYIVHKLKNELKTRSVININNVLLKLKPWIFIYIYYLTVYNTFKKKKTDENAYFKNDLIITLRHPLNSIYPVFEQTPNRIKNCLQRVLNSVDMGLYFYELLRKESNTDKVYNFGDGEIINETTFFPYNKSEILFEFRLFRMDLKDVVIRYTDLNNYNNFKIRHDIQDIEQIHQNFSMFQALHTDINIPIPTPIPIPTHPNISIDTTQNYDIQITKKLERVLINPLDSLKKMMNHIVTYYKGYYDMLLVKKEDIIDWIYQDIQVKKHTFYKKYKKSQQIKLHNIVYPYEVFCLILNGMAYWIRVPFKDTLRNIYRNYIDSSIAGEEIASDLKVCFNTICLLYDAIENRDFDSSLKLMMWINHGFLIKIAEIIEQLEKSKQGGYHNEWFHHCY